MNEKQLEALRASLGLAADATVEQILKASAERGAEIATLKAEAVKLKASSTPAEVITAAVAPIKAQVDTLTAELAKRDAALLERDVNDAVSKARRGDGKMGRTITEKLVAHAMRVAKSDGLAAAVEFLEAIPASVPVQALGTDTTEEGAVTPATAHQKLIAAADANAKDGITGAAAMEKALRENPELARVARQLTTNRNTKES